MHKVPNIIKYPQNPQQIAAGWNMLCKGNLYSWSEDSLFITNICGTALLIVLWKNKMAYGTVKCSTFHAN